MTPQTISEVIEVINRNELQAFSIEDVNGKDKYDGFNSEKNTKDTVDRFTEVSGKLPTGTYKVKAWKIGGQANPYTRFFSVGTQTQAQTGESSDLMYRLGYIEAESKYKEEIQALKYQLLELKRSKVKKPKVNPLHAIIANGLTSAPIIQQKIADLMGDEKGQAFLLKMNSLQNSDEDDDDDDDDEND